MLARGWERVAQVISMLLLLYPMLSAGTCTCSAISLLLCHIHLCISTCAYPPVHIHLCAQRPQGGDYLERCCNSMDQHVLKLSRCLCCCLRCWLPKPQDGQECMDGFCQDDWLRKCGRDDCCQAIDRCLHCECLKGNACSTAIKSCGQRCCACAVICASAPCLLLSQTGKCMRSCIRCGGCVACLQGCLESFSRGCSNCQVQCASCASLCNCTTCLALGVSCGKGCDTCGRTCRFKCCDVGACLSGSLACAESCAKNFDGGLGCLCRGFKGCSTGCLTCAKNCGTGLVAIAALPCVLALKGCQAAGKVCQACGQGCAKCGAACGHGCGKGCAACVGSTGKCVTSGLTGCSTCAKGLGR